MAGNVITMNDEDERICGWKREELLGKPINTIIPTEHHRGGRRGWKTTGNGNDHQRHPRAQGDAGTVSEFREAGGPGTTRWWGGP